MYKQIEPYVQSSCSTSASSPIVGAVVDSASFTVPVISAASSYDIMLVSVPFPDFRLRGGGLGVSMTVGLFGIGFLRFFYKGAEVAVVGAVSSVVARILRRFG